MANSKKWSELPQYPYHGGGLAVVNGMLTATGGCTSGTGRDTDKLLSLSKSWLSKNWTEIFPSMPTRRQYTTAVTSKEHLTVAGGATGPGNANTVSTVEVMNTKTLIWSTLSSLPHPYCIASATTCGDQLFIMGGWDAKDKTKSVLTCSVTELHVLQLTSHSSSSSSSVGHRVADALAYCST